MSKLNAFLAAIPANGLPSPTATKTQGMPANKGFPSLTIPQVDEEDQTTKMSQPSTPQPPHHRRSSRASAGGTTVRDLARRFDSQRSLPVDCMNDEDHHPASGNQEDADDTNQKLTLPTTQASTPSKPRLNSFHATPRGRSGSLEEVEAGPLRRLNVTQQLQQQHQSLHTQHQHHRRISTDTAMFSKLLKKQPHQDIDGSVVQFFTELPVATISRPEQDSNQVEEDSDNTAAMLELLLDPVELLAGFRRGETISVTSTLRLIQQATNVMTLEPNIVSVRAPFTVVGDLHGQFSDLVEIFTVHGMPSPAKPFLFLGDYVDRGVASCEIILLLLAFKVKFPSSIYLLRGNHECRSLSTFYGFRTECLKKYGLAVYNRMIKCFESMPLAAKITTSFGVFLAVHGGLSPSITYLEEINDKVNRFMEPDPSGALCDLLWADPVKDTHKQSEPFAANAVRGCSYTFNEQVCRTFLANNGLLAIIRAHELEEDGFREHFSSNAGTTAEEEADGDLAMAVKRLPPVVTVFSAPEYCNTNHNMGATLLIPWERKKPNGRLLEYSQHTRSEQREASFTGVSEHEAVLAFLKEQLPFLPVDFYELIVVCRQLRATLDVAASIATPVVSSANVMQDKSAIGSELVLPVVAEALTATKPVLTPFIPVEDRRSHADHTSTEQGDDEQLPHNSAKVAHTRMSTVEGSSPYARSAVPRRRASTGSGLRLCPGFMRFCEKFLGMQFEEPPSSPPPLMARIAMPETKTKKRRSIDDIQVGTSSSPPKPQLPPSPQEETRPTSLTATTPLIGKNNLEIFTTSQWSALRLYFSLLDVNGTGVLLEESFVVLLAEQDSDAYATQDELQLLMDVVDCNGDGLITAQDFLQFAYRAFLRWKKNAAPRLSKISTH